ncbi:MAG: recombination protein RecR [Deltaproteobacteria bacterium]|nr:recombination protein RecR [Deltaproteobacteria bacterium]MBI4373703.1 recombination protein RecR [Deltaproteobacteria bacterium]
MNPFERLVKVLRQLPGIGEKSASRLALFLLKDDRGVSQEIAQALIAMKEKIHFCKLCQNLTEVDFCAVCRDTRRNASQICIVEGPQDQVALEKTGEYRGYYYLLHGVISPLDGVGPDEMKLDRLVKRIREGGFSEVILATNPNPEGEATALHLKKILAPLGVKLSRIASGVPVGGTLEYSDAQTLARSLLTRREF